MRNRYLFVQFFYHFLTLRWLRITIGRQKHDYFTWSISWLLMTWQCQEPGHQQLWYWPSLFRTDLGPCMNRVNSIHLAGECGDHLYHQLVKQVTIAGLPTAQVNMHWLHRQTTICVVGGLLKEYKVFQIIYDTVKSHDYVVLFSREILITHT